MAFLAQRGGYRKPKAYQISVIIYDITYYFTHKYLGRGDRTIDQMVQAARSGKQNIAEGSAAATTSCETEIKLTNVARASLQELLIDYEDYLRVRQLEQWSSSHTRYERMRAFVKSEQFMQTYASLLEKLNDEELANVAITLIHQADFLLGRLIDKQQERFVQEGGIREQMTQARLRHRNDKRK